jgi:hypothetical protein
MRSITKKDLITNEIVEEINIKLPLLESELEPYPLTAASWNISRPARTSIIAGPLLEIVRTDMLWW